MEKFDPKNQLSELYEKRNNRLYCSDREKIIVNGQFFVFFFNDFD